ncbi:radical SAM protein [Vulgatibacter incomptus]|uniref:Ribosomal RNA large subunit methyltransferase N n=1 Tax=Vulgatibacter incomptus TaxID=1391653 RepID=A0A0K1PHB0_9BACT|nr:radical SAM protein [Vulgatibacter incomptus]AKU92509.1 Ribosomal RNA large subunit methyltransferase N [Vulgatibacter incomptus]
MNALPLAPPSRIVLQDLTEAGAIESLGALGATPSEARKVWSAAVKRRRLIGEIRQTAQVRRTVFDAVEAACATPRLEVIARRTDPADGFTKYLFGLEDGQRVEAVRIPIFDTHYVVCVSSQVGCALACDFCATGRMGFKRNLRPWEIVEQIFTIREEADRPVKGVVFMGMGEPFLNYRNVIAAAQILSAPAGGAIEGRSITISTAGWIPMIERFTDEGHPYRLAVSLTSAIPEKRVDVMPIEKRWPLPDLMAAVRRHAIARRTRAMLAYVVIRGFNTGYEDAVALKELVGDTPVKIDLIEVNDASGRYLPPDKEELERFRDHLQILGAPVVRRYSGGKSIEGACGMLAGGG